jgi:hypothetical protein
VARLEALLGKRADEADDAERAAELGASFVATLARHQAGPEEYWSKAVGTSIPQPDGYSGCGIEKPSWAKPEVTVNAFDSWMEAGRQAKVRTGNYTDPTPQMLEHPLWNAIWKEIKSWDINVPSEYHGYSEATGNHVTAIYLAIKNRNQ